MCVCVCVYLRMQCITIKNNNNKLFHSVFSPKVTNYVGM